MVQVASNNYVSNKRRLGAEARQVLQTESCLGHLLFKYVVRLVARRLNNWLSQRLCILVHDQSLNAWSKHLLSIGIILLIFVKYYLVASFVLLII